MVNIFTCATRGRDPENPTDRKHPSMGRFCQRLEVGMNGISNTITSVAKDAYVFFAYA